jgi:cytochrome c5
MEQLANYRIHIVFILMILSLKAFPASHNPQQLLESIRGTPDEGEQIVQSFCVTCHGVKPLINLGAPKIGVENDWKDRVKQGLDRLFEHTDQGYGAMPARGGCFECSDQQLRLAILAMLPKTLTKAIKKAES